MKRSYVVIIVIVAVVLVLFFWIKGMYNSMVRTDETVSQAWAQVENVYQRRADLVPNLVATVKGLRLPSTPPLFPRMSSPAS